jgi:tetratricopeptide (TPR) repeat protein
MPRKPSFRQLMLSILAAWNDLSWKQVGTRAGIPEKQVSQHLRRGALTDKTYGRLLAALQASPAQVARVTSFLEDMEALENGGGLTPEEKDLIERSALLVQRTFREGMTEAALLSRTAPPADYPRSEEVSALRNRAARLWQELAKLPERVRLEVVQVARSYQGWALCERVCQESVTEASRKVERAAGLARLAQEIAGRVPGPETWRNLLRGYASAHAANVLRVSGELNAADSLFEEAKRLWNAGADPDAVLDPGRLFDLEASLRRDQRRFDEALTALDAAVQVGRSPERVLINKGFVLEVMGRYEEAIETLAQAEPLVEQYGDLRLSYMLRFNLAVNYCHVGRFHEAIRLVGQVRELAADLGDEVFLIRVLWLEGRIKAGLGTLLEARELLAQARREFSLRGMAADASLALLEEAAILLDEGRTPEVKNLTRELPWILRSKGVHMEALAALRIFQKAAEVEEATADMVRGLLRFLYRARYDQGLRFTS